MEIEVGGIYEAKFYTNNNKSMPFQLLRKCNTTAHLPFTETQNLNSSFMYPPQNNGVFMWQLMSMPPNVLYPPSFYHLNNQGYITTPFHQTYLPHTPFITNQTSLKRP